MIAQVVSVHCWIICFIYLLKVLSIYTTYLGTPNEAIPLEINLSLR